MPDAVVSARERRVAIAGSKRSSGFRSSDVRDAVGRNGLRGGGVGAFVINGPGVPGGVLLLMPAAESRGS